MSRFNTNFGYIPDENYGYVPDEDVPQDVAEFDAMTGKYDPTGQPAIVSWDSFEHYAQEQAAAMDKIRAAGWIVLWWVIAKTCRVRDNDTPVRVKPWVRSREKTIAKIRKVQPTGTGLSHTPSLQRWRPPRQASDNYLSLL